MEEVLEKMYEDTCTAISRDERELFLSQLRRGQIYDSQKLHEWALLIWATVLEEVKERSERKQAEVIELRKSNMDSESDCDSDTESSRMVTNEDGLQDERLAKRVKLLRTKRGNELRDLQDLQHRATFMMASAHFQLKNEKEETRLYDEAEILRRKVYSFIPVNGLLSLDTSPFNQESQPLHLPSKRHGG